MVHITSREGAEFHSEFFNSAFDIQCLLVRVQGLKHCSYFLFLSNTFS